MTNDIIHPVHQLYNTFIEECLLKNNSILTNEEDIFTLENLKKVKICFLDSPIEDSNQDFWQKIKQQFEHADYETKLCFAHLNWLWSLPAHDITADTKEKTPIWILGEEVDIRRFNECRRENFFPKYGVGSTGQYHKTNKPVELNYLLILCITLKEKVDNGGFDKEAINAFIIENADILFEENTYSIGEAEYRQLKNKTIAMQSLMLHLANPDKYEPIASKQDKLAIKQHFDALIKDLPGLKEDINLDEEVSLIKEQLVISQQELQLDFKNGFSFYNDQLWHIWNKGIHNLSDDLMALQYKKAIVYYGPPGTGKTHSANALAESLIAIHFLHKKENLQRFLKDKKTVVDGRIHHLQFNPNTSYEDFIAGYQLKSTPDGSETVPVEGQLFNIIEKANQETETTDKDNKIKLPHVLILDEINRVDLSRVFGELFSAMEYRNKPIETAIKGITLIIPDNLYIIGTMNEIDFSVERMDFALRRRFLWKFKGYDKDVLFNMLSQNSHDKLSEHIEGFVNDCTLLNEYISTKIDELGVDYQIGHTFFAELPKIYEQNANLTGKSRNTLKLYKEARDILWNFSIKPMLEAFLGNTDKKMVQKYLTNAKKFFTHAK
ncbi:AAA family ATPase [uncultured Psychrobacter sp.]|uniref:McrB family protein n=1 Tax=uncultured Psychrobacter sp. TaxID=259303 RepID=UPI00261EE132|nr:AAA family ATPase [uncultured Psychrobacter sp.]